MADTHYHGNSCQVLGWATDKSGDCLCKFASWHFMNSRWVRSRCYANAAEREQLRTSRLNEPANQVCYVPRPELLPDGKLEHNNDASAIELLHNCNNHTTMLLGRLPSAFTYESEKQVNPEVFRPDRKAGTYLSGWTRSTPAIKGLSLVKEPPSPPSSWV